MDRWQDDLIGAVSGDSASEREVFECIQRASRALGFQHVSYGFQAPLPLSRPKFTWLNDYPGDWQTHYMDAGYPAVDPRIIRARQSSEPFIWNEALFSEVPELWADLQARGIQHGWSQSTLHEPGGIGMLSLCRSTPITEQDLQTRLQHMQWLALLAHKAFSKLIRARIASNAPSLTERELEVLRWTADGKSAQDIAEILLLSKNTVDSISGIPSTSWMFPTRPPQWFAPCCWGFSSSAADGVSCPRAPSCPARRMPMHAWFRAEHAPMNHANGQAEFW